ncbi:MAG: hypothetical protein AAF581_23715 [Planctomycetota bacterium]
MAPRKHRETFAIGIVLLLLAAGAAWYLIVGQHWAAAPYDADAIAALPFDTGFTVAPDGESSTNPGRKYSQVKAFTRRYGAHGAALIDIGDVRLAIEGWNPRGGVGRSSLPIDTDRPASMGGRSRSSGGGKYLRFSRNTEGGVTTCLVQSHGHYDIQFSIAHMVLTIGDQEIALGQGQRVVYLSDVGAVQSVRVLNHEPAQFLADGPRDSAAPKLRRAVRGWRP